MLFLPQWAFGILLWEIVTRGIVPYSYLDPKDQLLHLKIGGRLGKPNYCPDALWVDIAVYQYFDIYLKERGERKRRYVDLCCS